MLDRRRLMLTAAALTAGAAAGPALATPSPHDDALTTAFEGSRAPALAGAVMTRSVPSSISQARDGPDGYGCSTLI